MWESSSSQVAVGATSSSTSSSAAHHHQANNIPSRALKDAATRRAKLLHFYQNGHPYVHRLTVSIGPKDFGSFEQLCAYLTEKCRPQSLLLSGVQYLFTTNGKRVTTLDELEHDQEYVLSGGRTFLPHPYGAGTMRIGGTGAMATTTPRISSRYKLLREDDLRLLRPLSSKYNSVYATANGSLGGTYPVNSRIYHPQTTTANGVESRLVRIVNNQNHAISSRVILNLRSPKSFDTMLRDLGQAVRMPVPKRMFTSSGLEVRSVSHLKHDLANVDLFYVDSEHHSERFQLLNKFHSLDSIEKFLESSVQRLNEISRAEDGLGPSGSKIPSISHSRSNVDLRPFHLEETNQSKQQQQTWQKSTDVTTYQIPLTNGQVKTPPKTLKPTTTTAAKKSTHIPTAIPTHSKAPSTKSSLRTKVTEPPSKDVQSRRRSISQSRESLRKTAEKQEAEELAQIELVKKDAMSFSLENISDAKFEQIQAYAEKMIQETSNQIKSERLLEKGITTSRKASIKQPKLKPAIRQPTTVSLQKSESSSLNKTGNTSVPKVKTLEPSLKTKDQNLQTPPTTVVQVATPPKGEKEEVPQGLPIVEPTITAKVVTNGGLQSSKPVTNFKLENSSSVQQPKPTSKAPPAGKKTSQGPPSTTQSCNSTKSNLSQKPRHTGSVSPRVERSCTSKTTQKSTTTNSRAASLPRKSTENGPTSKTTALVKSKTPALPAQPTIKPEKHLQKGVNVPNRYLELSRIFGYNGQRRKNLHHVHSTGELLFTSGVFVVLWNVKANRQRFYAEHDSDIYIMRVDSKSQYAASAQIAVNSGGSGSKASIIRIWSVKSLATLAVLKQDRSLSMKITDMEFTVANSLFVVSHSEAKLSISIWNWNASKVIASASKTLENDESVFGGTVHPVENDIMVTFGKMHLVVWHMHKDKSTMDYRTALQTHSKLVKTIHCADFLGDNSLLTGDAAGHLTIWAPFEVNSQLEFAVKEVKGHEAPLTVLRLTPDSILVSADEQGAIKTWDVGEGEFRLLNGIKLSALCGAVSSVALPVIASGKGSDEEEVGNGSGLEVFVGTTENFLLRGALLQSTSYDIVFEGHIMAIRTIAFDPQEDLFYTASLDQKVCKWSSSALVWRTSIDVQAISSAVHPGGQILAIGSVSGIVSILACVSGEVVHHLEIGAVPIGCMAYSADGHFLVAGCQDGALHVLPVSDDGFTYSKVSVLKGPLPILTLQWSVDTQFILTSVDDNNYQELILWDLHNTRYIRNVTNFSDNLRWHNATCSGLEDARGTWDNEKLKNVVNICNHYSPSLGYIVTGDESGHVRLFTYPCLQTNAAFFEYKQGGGSVTDIKISPKETIVVDCNFEGSILLWTLKEYIKDGSTTSVKSKV